MAMTASERARLGGLAVKARYGSDHFRELQRRSWAKQVEKNPLASFRLSRAWLRSMDVAPENGAWQRRDWGT
jgi:hypothetical protein